MALPNTQFRWIMVVIFLVILIASTLLVFGILDQEHWTSFVQGLLSLGISGTKQ